MDFRAGPGSLFSTRKRINCYEPEIGLRTDEIVGLGLVQPVKAV